MKSNRLLHFFVCRLLLLASAVVAFGITPAIAGSSTGGTDDLGGGYSVLRLLLKDEQHLTTIRRVKLVIAFESVSDSTAALVDRIADTSSEALEELARLAKEKPAIEFKEFSDDSIGKATLDSLRIATAKQFLLETDDFEKDLLLSQAQVLHLISHLARQLEEKEINTRRKTWLGELAQRYGDHYREVYARIAITRKNKA
jgi:hypothetical protein